MAGMRRGFSPGDAGYLELKQLEVKNKQRLGQEDIPTLQGVLSWIHSEVGRSLEASDWAAVEQHAARFLRMLTDGRQLLSRQP